MPRKRIELETAGLKTPRERMWSAMRKRATFSASQIEDDAYPITIDGVRSYIDGLVAAGYVDVAQKSSQRAGDARFTQALFRVIKPVLHAPPLDREGKPVKVPLGTVAMWRAMKVRKKFDARQISNDATQGDVMCSLDTVKTYCKHLERAGYLRIEKASRGGVALTVYVLVKDTGPHPPAITRAKAVFDRNTGVLLVTETPQEVCDASER